MEVTKWLKPLVKRVTNGCQRECAGRNASERRASLEKDDAQADPAPRPGKADRAGEVSETSTQSLRRGSGDSMYTREAQAGVVRDGQPEAREGQAGRLGVEERPVGSGDVS